LQAIVLEEQGGRVRLYAVNRRESSLSAGRLLPWSGPALGSGLSRQRMDEALEEHRALRLSLAADISSLELWDLTQGEVPRASAEWLAGLLWTQPTIDQEAALGHALLAAKFYFRFSPPDFEIFSQDVVKARLAEAEIVRIREAFAVAGAQFFQKLWEIHSRKRGPLTPQDLPEESLAAKLRELLLDRIADPEAAGDAATWKLLVKGLPDIPHIPLLLAVAWNLVPEHYNFWLDRIGFDSGETWANAFPDDCLHVRKEAARVLAGLEAPGTPAVSVDPAATKDRDDAFFVRRHDDGGFSVSLTLACPAVAWPFDSPLDRAVLRRSSSLYLPEGNEHMLPADIGRNIFSLDAGTTRPALHVSLRLSSDGSVLATTPSLVAANDIRNLDLESCEAALLQTPDSDETGNAAALPPAAMLRSGLALARLLQDRRIADGAVITESSDPEVIVEGRGAETVVRIEAGPEATLSHFLVGELMVLCNASLAAFGRDQGIPLLYRTQDVALPREFAGVWTEAHEISRVVRALPPACLEITPKRHAGLGLHAYATFSSPIRRYTDLVNQSQIIGYLLSGRPRLEAEALAALLPLLSTRSDAASQVQRQRPRYWKLVFFRQQGEKHWWDAVVADENEAIATIALPWAQLMVRGKRRQFADKIYPGMRVQVRLGKVNPLLGEIQVLEAREG
jgi:exoribonuclease-2